MENKKNKEDPFADYMWMENIEDFDREVEEQLLEEEFIRTCIEQLLEEEDEREKLTAAEIIAQQQLQTLQNANNSVQQGTGQSSFRNGFQGTTGYTNGYSSFDYNILVSSRIANPRSTRHHELCHCERCCVYYWQVQEVNWILFILLLK